MEKTTSARATPAENRFDLSKRENLERIRTKCEQTARRFKRRELADDFTSAVLLWFVEGKRQHSTFDQMFIDYLRGAYGRTGGRCGSKRPHPHRDTVSISPAGSVKSNREGDLEWTPDELVSPVPDDLGVPSGGDRQAWKFAFLFGGRELEIYQRILEDGEQHREIAEDFGVTESRISQIYRQILLRIEKARQLREALERFEWDESFGRYAVEWIRL